MSDPGSDGINQEKYGHRTSRHVWLWATAPFRKAELERSDKTKPAIYFIHGTADWASSGIDIAESIPKPLYSKFHLVSFKNRLRGKNIDSFSIQLAHKIKFENDKNVILIGHSRGGLVATRFAQEYANDLGVTVHSVIAIATPYKGSDLATWPLTSISDSVKDYQKESEFLRKLHSQEISTSHIFIAAEKDRLVRVKDTYLPNREEPNKIIENENHLSVMHSVKLLDYVKKIFSQPPISELKLGLPVQEDKSSEDPLDELTTVFEAIKNSDHCSSTIKNIPMLAEQSKPSKANKTDYRNWKLGVQLAIEYIQKPTELSRKLLSFHATHFTPGHSVAWEKFAGALAMLAAVAVGALILANSPLIAGLSVASLYIGTPTLFAAGAAFIYHGRQKSLSLAYSQLAACDDDNHKPKCDLTK